MTDLRAISYQLSALSEKQGLMQASESASETCLSLFLRGVFLRRRIAAGLALLMVVLSVTAHGADPNPASIHSSRGAWPLYRQWNPAEVRHFAEWVRQIHQVKTYGTQEQRAARLEHILTDPEMNLLLDPAFAGDPVNPQLERRTMLALHERLDCAKLTIALTGYYAYRRGLPWMITWIRSGDGTDVRRSAYNVPTWSVSCIEYPSTHTFLLDASQGFCTGNYRVEPDRENSELSDTVPVAIEPEFLMPGGLFYLDGHVLVLGNVDPYGDVEFLDATTAASRDVRVGNGYNAVTGIPAKKDNGPAYAGCFRGFRIQRYPYAEVDDDGNVLRVRRRTDEEMKVFGLSTEQYGVMDELFSSQHIVEDNLSLGSFHDFVRYRLRTEQIRVADVIESSAERLLGMLRDRERLVQDGWRDVLENGPITFPEDSEYRNIFTATGRWGRWSTASYDAAIRAEYFRLVRRMENAVRWFRTQPTYVDLEGIDFAHLIWGRRCLASMIVAKKDQIFADKKFLHRNSDGRLAPLSLLDVEDRLHDLSFDPNHPPELRWGAAPGSAGAASAPEAPTRLPDGSRMPMTEAFLRQAFYRTLSQADPIESSLSGMTMDGFPIPSKFEGRLALYWRLDTDPVPPLIPHMTRGQWFEEQSLATVSPEKLDERESSSS